MSDTQPSLSPARVRAVTAGVILVSFIGALDATVVAAAIPMMVKDLGGLSLYAWVVTAYLLAMTVSGPVWGKLSDLYGRRRVYLSCVVTFMVGAALCGQARTMVQLILARLLQGLGAGGLTPVGQTVLADIYSVKQRAKVQAMITTIFGVATLVGPVLGGWLAQHATWRWIFYLNVPFGVAGAVLLGLSLPRDVAGDGKHRLDTLGTALFASGLSLFLVWTHVVNTRGWTDPWALAMLLVSVVLLGAFVALEPHQKDALLPPALFGFAAVRADVILMVCLGSSLYGATTYLPLYCQSILGQTATESGQSLIPLLATWVLAASLSTWMMARMSYRVPAVLGFLSLTLGYLIFSMLPATPGPQSEWMIWVGGTLVGLSGGLCTIPLLLAAQGEVPHAMLGITTSAVLFFRSVGGALGVTIMGALLSMRMGSNHQLMGAGLRWVFLAGLTVSLVALAATTLLPPPPDKPEGVS